MAMTATPPPVTPPEATDGERLARLEALTEALVREVSDLKADGRDIRAEMRAEFRDIRNTMNRNLLITIGVVVTMWVTVILAILAILFRM